MDSFLGFFHHKFLFSNLFVRFYVLMWLSRIQEKPAGACRILSIQANLSTQNVYVFAVLSFFSLVVERQSPQDHREAIFNVALVISTTTRSACSRGLLIQSLVILQLKHNSSEIWNVRRTFNWDLLILPLDTVCFRDLCSVWRNYSIAKELLLSPS